MNFRTLCRMALLACLMVAAGCSRQPTAAARPEDADPRVQRALAELKTAQEVLAEVTNEADRAVWQARVGLAEKEVTNTRRLVHVEEREELFVSQRRMRTDYHLREALRAVETSTVDAEAQVRDRNFEIRQLKARRASIKPVETAEAETEEGLDRQALDDLRLRNLDAEILAKSIERDAAELRIRLAREAERIEQFLRTLELNPRATLGLIMDKRGAEATVRKTRDEMALLRDSLQAQHDESGVTLSLARQRFAQLDEEIALLQDRLRVEKRVRAEGEEKFDKYDRQRRARQMLSTARNEKTMLGSRIDLLQAQIASLEESIGLSKQAHELLEAELAFRGDDLGIIRGRYLRRVLTPILAITIIVLAYALISRFVFPLFLSKDSLFVARRLGGYGLLLVIAALLVAVFLEDLTAIATAMGIVGAAIVVVHADFFAAFTGWFVIVTSRKIKVGDRVEIDGHRGDVIDIQMLRTTLVELNKWLGVDEPTGRVFVIPNTFIFKSNVFNYSFVHPFIWGKIDITVTFETPYREAYDLFMRVLEEESREEFAAAARGEELMDRKYGHAEGQFGPRIHTVIADSGVCFSLHYVAHYRRFTATRDRISARLVVEVDKSERVNFAYPTARHIPTAEEGGFQVRLHEGRTSQR